MHQIALDLHRVEAPTLENFVAGRNGEALACLRALRDAVCAGAPPGGSGGSGGPGHPDGSGGPGSSRDSGSPGGPGEPLPPGVPLVYLWGPPGCGKTHLALGTAGTPHTLAADAAPAAFEALLADAAERPRIAAVLDVERLDAARQSLLFHLVNRMRAQPASTLIVTGEQPPLALDLRDDLRTRLGAGLVYRLQLLDDDEKAAALQRVARERGVAMAPDVVPWLIAHTSRDIRALLRTFDALDRLAFERRRAITLPLLRELLQDMRAAGEATMRAAVSDHGDDGLPS